MPRLICISWLGPTLLIAYSTFSSALITKLIFGQTIKLEDSMIILTSLNANASFGSNGNNSSFSIHTFSLVIIFLDWITNLLFRTITQWSLHGTSPFLLMGSGITTIKIFRPMSGSNSFFHKGIPQNSNTMPSIFDRQMKSHITVISTLSTSQMHQGNYTTESRRRRNF